MSFYVDGIVFFLIIKINRHSFGSQPYLCLLIYW
ncbi:MAG TPA: DUF2933 domain-containing protein [Candidatus Jeotgalibaca pullicola]|nr:DUF2933 domain-containing protein [Candidatus Jeotgalibaca pullicola]